MNREAGVRSSGARLILRAGVAVLLFCAGCASTPPALDYQPIIGTRVRLGVPDGFDVARRFPGLVSENGASSVIVSEIDSPVEEVEGKLSEREFSARGMTWLGSEKVSIDDYDGVLVRALEKDASGRELARWILVFGKPDSGIMISASTLATGDEELGKQLRNVLVTAKWDPDEALDPYAGLGFRVREAGLLKVSDRLPTMVSFTVGGHRGRLNPGDPLFLAGTSPLKNRVTNIEAFGMQRLREMPELEDTEVVSSQTLELDGLPAYQLVAETSDGPTGIRMVLHQTVVISSTRFFLLQGMVNTKNANEFVPLFRQIAMSFQQTR